MPQSFARLNVGSEQGDETVGCIVAVIAAHGLVQAHHFVAGEVRESAGRPGRGQVPPDHPFVFEPRSFVGFRVKVQVFVDQLRERFFRTQRRSLCVALADRVFAARDLGFVLQRFRAGFHDAEVRKPAERIATHAAIDPSFPHEALRAAAGYPNSSSRRTLTLLARAATASTWLGNPRESQKTATCVLNYVAAREAGTRVVGRDPIKAWSQTGCSGTRRYRSSAPSADHPQSGLGAFARPLIAIRYPLAAGPK